MRVENMSDLPYCAASKAINATNDRSSRERHSTPKRKKIDSLGHVAWQASGWRKSEAVEAVARIARRRSTSNVQAVRVKAKQRQLNHPSSYKIGLMPHKIPRSVLVVIHTPQNDVLLIERANEQGLPSGTWQSVTGSLDFEGEAYAACAAREVREETGLDVHGSGHQLTDWHLENTYDIWPHYLHRYEPGVTRNTERVFGLCIPASMAVKLAPAEHVNQIWLPWEQAAVKVMSASNEVAIRRLAHLKA